MTILFFGMAFSLVALIFLGNTASLLMVPPTTPEQFLAGMPYSTFSFLGQDRVLIQPSSTFFVYLLGVLMILLGVVFLNNQKGQRSRYLWGIGMVLWGVSAIVAGTSYQAFGYELKCRGQELCLFTSTWELAYMLITAYSINFLVAATGYTSAGVTGRKWMVRFAIADSIAYTAYILIGAILPIKFLVTYEGFMAFIGANFLLMFFMNIRYYRVHHDALNKKLIQVWLGFLLVNIGYFAFLFGGFGASMYQASGLWFNENDALHVLLIAWSAFIYFAFRDEDMDVSAG